MSEYRKNLCKKYGIPTDPIISGPTLATLLCLSLLAVFIWSFWSMWPGNPSSDMRVKEANFKAACLKLAPKFGEHFTAKEGFYQGVRMNIVEAGDTCVTLQISGSNKERQFRCSDVERVK